MLKLDKSIAPAFFFTIFLSIMVLDDAALQLKMFALALFLFTFTLTSSTIMVKKIHLDFYLIGFFITLFFISFIPLILRAKIFAILFGNKYFCEILRDNLVSGLFLIHEFFNKELLIPKKKFSFLNFKFTFYKFYFF